MKTSNHPQTSFQKFSKQAKLKNSCSQMWLIEQLYIELGCAVG